MLLSVSAIKKVVEDNVVLDQINFHQDNKEKIAIAGETGSGKSTLLKIIAGLVQPDEGEVRLENEKVAGPYEKLVAGHKDIAYVSQHFELPKFLRVAQVLNYANNLNNQYAEALFEVCRISHLLERKTNELSGGERQRIALARLISTSPKLLLLDEPYSNLDIIHKRILKSVIHDVGEKLKISCVLVSHDPVDTLSWADKILVMKEGKVVQEGTPQQVYRQPVTEYVAGIFGNYSLINHENQSELYNMLSINKSKSLIIRPEDFVITQQGSKSIAGKVIDVVFFGSYCELEVEISTTSITVRTQADSYRIGDHVYVKVEPGRFWEI